MGRVRTNLIKKAAKSLIEKYYGRMTLDFDTNKRLLEDVAQVPSKRIRNKIAGFSTHLMKRVVKGSKIRGISLRLQEEEREKKLDFAPEHSAFSTADAIQVDEETGSMLKTLQFEKMTGITVSNKVETRDHKQRPGQQRRGGDRQRRPNAPRRNQKPKEETPKTEEKQSSW
eukprot:TRINITY_DN6018_c0_g1_i1.p1 TRINITY_DN6018_c0_g1~~TRINITY_DN6018_c0_g1_i1.p1  ORF type:complete len:171 (-),score=40.59 TRINITY_DN6018_c0_g1_i1:97-609(-)